MIISGMSVQVLVAHGSTVTLVDADAATDQELQHGPIRRLAVAPNGQFLAAFTDEGKLIVWTADFGKFLSEFATQSDSPPEQLAWCGTDSVVLFWEVRVAATLKASGPCMYLWTAPAWTKVTVVQWLPDELLPHTSICVTAVLRVLQLDIASFWATVHVITDVLPGRLSRTGASC